MDLDSLILSVMLTRIAGTTCINRIVMNRRHLALTHRPEAVNMTRNLYLPKGSPLASHCPVATSHHGILSCKNDRPCMCVLSATRLRSLHDPYSRHRKLDPPTKRQCVYRSVYIGRNPLETGRIVVLTEEGDGVAHHSLIRDNRSLAM